MTRVSTFPDLHAAAAYTANEIADALREALEQRGVAHLALSGGNSPRSAYEALAGLLDDWSAVQLWYCDERCVAPDDPESTHRLVEETLLAPISALGRALPREHRVRGELPPEQAAREYEEELRAAIAPDEHPSEEHVANERDGADHRRTPTAGDGLPAHDVALPAHDVALPAHDVALPAHDVGLPVLDVALLGIGEDGHTASLFPGHPEVSDESGALCLPVYDSPKPPPERVTLTLPVLRAARRTLLLVAGAGKADALAAMLRGPDPRVPASLVAGERLHVIADTAATGAAMPQPPSFTPPPRDGSHNG